MALAEVPTDEQTPSTDPSTVAAVPSVFEISDETELATVNGQKILWSDVKQTYDNLLSQYGSYYDLTDPVMVTMFQVYALENVVSKTLLLQQVKENGLELSVEDKAASDVESDAMWEEAIQNYIKNSFPDLTETSTDQEKADARAKAEAYYGELGYTQQILRDQVAEEKGIQRLDALVTQDAVVTDADVEADYQAKVAADKAQFENDIAAYIDYNNYVDQSAMYAMMSGGTGSDMDHAWYKPAGFRAVKHILLPVAEELMSKYKDLQARLEEQMDAEAAKEQGAVTENVPEDVAQPDAAPEATATAAATQPPPPVTQADVDNAKADILQSLQGTIDEINQKIAEGVDFDELIATYGVNADGSASDPGMSSEPYKTNGYEVAKESTSSYVTEFVDAAFSMNSIGDVSAPYVSDYGVHILKYLKDVEAGPVPITTEQREAKRAALLQGKKNELFATKLDEWRTAAAVTYTGVIPSATEFEAAQAAEAQEVEEMSVEGMEPEAQDAPAPEVSETAVP